MVTGLGLPVVVLASALALQAPGVDDGDRIVQTLRNMRDAVNRGDARAYAAVYSPDATIEIHGVVKLTGRGEIERHESELLKQFPGVRFGFYRVWPHDRSAVAHYVVNAEFPDGRPMGHEGLLFFEFDGDGLIAKERRFQDSLTPSAQFKAVTSERVRGQPRLPIEMLTASSSPGDEQENVSAALRIVSSIHAGQRDPALRWKDAATIDELILERPFEGSAGAAEWARFWGVRFGDTSYGVESIHSVGQFVIVRGVLRGTLTSPVGPLTPSSKAFSVHRALVIEFDRKQVASIKAFMNGRELAEALGQWPIRERH